MSLSSKAYLLFFFPCIFLHLSLSAHYWLTRFKLRNVIQLLQLFYLFGRRRLREHSREPFYWITPQLPQGLGRAGHTEAGSWKLRPCFLCGWQGPIYLSHHLLPLRMFFTGSQSQEQRQDSNLDTSGTLTIQNVCFWVAGPLNASQNILSFATSIVVQSAKLLLATPESQISVLFPVAPFPTQLPVMCLGRWHGWLKRAAGGGPSAWVTLPYRIFIWHLDVIIYLIVKNLF